MKKVIILFFAFLLIGCVNPSADINPVSNSSYSVSFREGSINHRIEFGQGSIPVSPNVVNQYKIGDSFSRVYNDLKKPVLARIQPDNGVVLVYSVSGANEKVYFVFRGLSGALVRVSNSPNTQK